MIGTTLWMPRTVRASSIAISSRLTSFFSVREHAKILDFGLARSLPRAVRQTRVQQPAR